MIQARGQQAFDAGPFLGAPVCVSVAGSSAAAGDELRFKPAGFRGSMPAPAAGTPDFRLATVFAGSGTCAGPGGPLQVDAVSVGLDLIPTDSVGRVLPPFLGEFTALLFSVRPGTVGASGSVLAREAASADGAQGDVFSYTLPGSRAGPVDLVERAVDSTEIRLTGATLAERDLDGLDYYAPLWSLAESRRVLGTTATLWFSVTAATAANLPTAWLGGNAQARSGATVFRTTWSGAAWSCPTVFRAPADLGLAQGDDVDALAIDTLIQQPEIYLVFSTAVTSVARSQLLFATQFTAGRNWPLLDAVSGQPVADRLGLGPGGDIDALTLVDPGRRVPPILLPHVRPSLALHAPGLAIVPRGGATAMGWRDASLAGDELVSFLLTPASGMALLVIEAAPGSGRFLDTLVVPRDPGFAGAPAVWRTWIPPTLDTHVGLHWLEVFPATGVVFAADPLDFRL